MYDILVGTDTGSFERLGAQLLILVGDEVNTAWEVVDAGALAAEIENAYFGVWHTAVEARFGVWLYSRIDPSVFVLMISSSSSPPKTVFAVHLRRPLARGNHVPCSCSSGSTSLDDEPLRQCFLSMFGGLCMGKWKCEVRSPVRFRGG